MTLDYLKKAEYHLKTLKQYLLTAVIPEYLNYTRIILIYLYQKEVQRKNH